MAPRTKIVGYVRVSTEGQAESGLSLEAQRAKLVAYADLFDLDLVEIVVDAGVSAKTLDRPGLGRVLELLRTGAADGVLIAKLDRLTRSVRDLGDLVDRYFASKYSLLSVADSIDTRSAAGRLVLNVLASVSQWEREAISERTSDALQAKKARGERVGTIPYGFRVGDGGKLEADEAEQVVLAEIRELRAAGLSHRAIVTELAERGFVSRGGKPFALASVHAMAKGIAA